MPTWSGILKELQEFQHPDRISPFDQVRRKYLAWLYQKTHRACILYATNWTQPDASIPPGLLSIGDEDLHGLMEVIHGISEPNLDLILHSPGGSLDAVEALVLYLRSKFNHIRVIVPQLAMSAATMIACAADEIVLGKHSFLGPIDPQLILSTPLGQRMVPAENILEQFEQAKKDCQDSSKLGAWLPMLNQYGPDLLVSCQNARALSKKLVRGWLENWMFKGDRDGKTRARRISEWLSNHSYFKSHGRHISRLDLERKKLKIVPLEKDPDLQDLVLSVFHATTHTFGGTRAVKIIENHLGKAFIKQWQATSGLVVPGRPPPPPTLPGQQ